jgi:predicted PurR-regulated permease PerM
MCVYNARMITHRHPLDKAAGWSWRLLSIFGLAAVLIFLVIQLKVIVIPFLVSLLVAALLYPLVHWLRKKGVKNGLAVAISLVSLIGVVSGLVFVVVKQFTSAYPELSQRAQTSFQNLQGFLAAEPFNIAPADLQRYFDDFLVSVQNSDFLTAGLVSSVGSTAGHVFAGIFLAIFAILFLLLDGRNIWNWVVNLLPKSARRRTDEAGNAGWHTLTSFVKSQIAVAGVDAIGIGLGALILQIPLVIPIAVMVFLGSFIPVVGAVITGAIAVLVALIFNGVWPAVIMLGVVLFVQLFEGHVLQPFLIGKAVKIHPLAIVFAVAIGSLLAGIPGALFAVPIVAVVNVMTSILLGRKNEVAVPKKS